MSAADAKSGGSNSIQSENANSVFQEVHLTNDIGGAAADAPAGRTAAPLPSQRVITPPEENTPLFFFGADEPSETVQRLLNGSQAKTAYALRMNAEKMISPALNRSGMLTLTVGDFHCLTHGLQIPKGRLGRCPVCRLKMAFKQCFDADEASARFDSLNSHILKKLFRVAIVVSERCKNSAIHFHVLGVLQKDLDIRTGFNFEQVKARNYSSVSAGLKEIWANLRDVLPRYGFGRAELTPIRKTAGAVASYVSKYIEKNICNRSEADKGRRLVRYLGWNKTQLKPNEFEWATKGAENWRAKITQVTRLAGVHWFEKSVDETDARILECCDAAAGRIRPKVCDWSLVKKMFGKRWAYTLTGIMRQVWGDDCDRLNITPSTLLQAIDLLDRAKARHNKSILDGFRWLKGLSFDLIRSDDVDESRRLWWQTEFEADGLKLDADYWLSMPQVENRRDAWRSAGFN